VSYVEEKLTSAYNRYIFPKRNAYGVQMLHNEVVRFLSQVGIPMSELAGKKVLDAGCGTGELSCFLAQHGAQVTGIDITQNSLAYARTQAQVKGLPNVTFIEGSLLDYPFREHEYDLIVSHMVLMVTADPERAFANIVRALKPGGSIVFKVFCFWGTMSPFQKSPLWKIWVVRLLGGKDLEKRVRIGERLFYKPGHEAAHGLEKGQYLYDLWGLPRISYHRWGELLGWLDRSGLRYHSSDVPMEFSKLVQSFLDKTEPSVTTRGALLRGAAKVFFGVLPIHRLPVFKRPTLLSRTFGQAYAFLAAGANMVTIRAIKDERAR